MLNLKTAPEQTDYDKILTLDEAKDFLHILDSEHDEVIVDSILSAITECEGLINRQFASAVFELYLPRLSCEIKLPKNPVNEITAIEYLDENGVYQTIDQSSYYLYKKYDVSYVVFEEVPSLPITTSKKAIRITFSSGYADKFPKDLKQWLKVRVSTLFEYREEMVIGTIVAKTNHVDSILDKYKIRSV